MKVSVAMATFNGGPYLAAQLASLVRQDRLPDELVISDDGSCDETHELVKEFAATAPFPVIMLRNPGPRGYQRNFDYALAATIGDVIVLADQDDVWLEHHVSRLVTPFETNPRLMVSAGDSEVMHATGQADAETVRDSAGMTPSRVRASNEAPGVAQFRQVLGRRAVAGHSMALRRLVLEVASPLPASWLYGEWIFVVGAAMGRVVYVDGVISRFREYARAVPGAEYRRAPSTLELTRWQTLLTRLRYAGALLPGADRALQDVEARVRLMVFGATVRQQRAPVRAVRVLPRLLAGRYHRLGRGFSACARDLVGG